MSGTCAVSIFPQSDVIHFIANTYKCLRKKKLDICMMWFFSPEATLTSQIWFVFYHSGRIFVCVCQGGTMLGPPDTVVELGETEVSEEIFMDYLSSLGESTYRLSTCFLLALFFLFPFPHENVIWWINSWSFLLGLEATGIVCLNTTATPSPTRWHSSWQAEPSPPTSPTSLLKSSPREWETYHSFNVPSLPVWKFCPRW